MQRDDTKAKATATGTIFTTDGVFSLSMNDLRVLRLSGKVRAGDPSGMLDAVLTSDVPKSERDSVYALLLNAKGRVLTDMTVLREGDGNFLLVLREAGLAAALETLGKYAPFSRVAIEETNLNVTGLFGSNPSSAVNGAPKPGEAMKTTVGGDDAVLYAGSRETGLFIISGSEPSELLEASGATPASHEDYETARIHASVPVFGRDITPDNFPAEAYLEKTAVDFSKGCYPGQETVARMHYRGQPNKYLHRFSVTGSEAEAGAPILQSGKTVGSLTSVAPNPVDGTTYALGYLKRRADTEGDLISGDAKLTVSEISRSGDQA